MERGGGCTHAEAFHPLFLLFFTITTIITNNKPQHGYAQCLIEGNRANFLRLREESKYYYYYDKIRKTKTTQLYSIICRLHNEIQYCY